jgi:hypothetical protein
MSISIAIIRTITNQEGNVDVTFRDTAITLYMAMTMNFCRAFSFPNIENCINGMWATAFCSVESKIISLAAVIAVSNSKIARIEDSQITFLILFVEWAVLK